MSPPQRYPILMYLGSRFVNGRLCAKAYGPNLNGCYPLNTKGVAGEVVIRQAGRSAVRADVFLRFFSFFLRCSRSGWARSPTSLARWWAQRWRASSSRGRCFLQRCSSVSTSSPGAEAGAGWQPLWLACTSYLFTLTLLCTNQPCFHSPRPPALPTLMQYHCTIIGQYTTPLPTPRLYAMHLYNICNNIYRVKANTWPTSPLGWN